MTDWIRSTPGVLVLAVTVGSVLGCSLAGGPSTDRPASMTPSATAAYSTDDLACVLRRCVRDGLVDYAALEDVGDRLDRFVAAIQQTGPESTPELFGSQASHVCYWVNAHNAVALQAALETWRSVGPLQAVQTALGGSPAVVVDGRSMRLESLRAAALAASDGDPRVLLAMCDGTTIGPRLASVLYCGDGLDRQLEAAGRLVVGNRTLVRIDHVAQQVLVPPVMVEHRKVFVEWYERRYVARGGDMLNVLLVLADRSDRERLNAAIGYRVVSSSSAGLLNVFTSVISSDS